MIVDAILLVSCLPRFSAGEIITLDLKPTASLLHQHVFRRRHHGHGRLLMEENDDLDDNLHLGMLMHPYNSAVYSSLVEIDETTSSHESLKLVADEHNQRLKEFNSLRHMSRHELFLKTNAQSVESFGEDLDFSGGREESRTRNLRVIQDGSRILQAEALPPLIHAEDREAKDGGLYREFQSAPLSQGYGTHYATLWGAFINCLTHRC